MAVISTGPYTNLAELERSVRIIYEGLQANNVIVALPQGDIEVRVASLWERVLSFIRFKPTRIRLATIQPRLSQFFRNNDRALRLSPHLYPMLLHIYLHSACPREANPPTCLKEKRSNTTPPSEPSANDEIPIIFSILPEQSTQEQAEIVSVPPENSDAELLPADLEKISGDALKEFTNYQRGADVNEHLTADEKARVDALNDSLGILDKPPAPIKIKVPYKLVKDLPCDITLSTNSAAEMPPAQLNDFSETVFRAFIKYQSEGQLEGNLSEEQLIELTELAAQFGDKELTKQALFTLIDMLNTGNDIFLFNNIIKLIVDLEIEKQEVILSLIAKGKSLPNLSLDNQKLEKAFPDKWLMKYILAQCYEHGIGMQQNFEQALTLYKNLSDEGNPWGQSDLGRCYHYVGKKYKEAFSLYELAAAQGLASARYHKAVVLNYGLGDVKQDTLEALNLFQRLAEEGHKLGLYGLGNFYQTGTRVPENLAKAVKLYELAGNEPRALWALGMLYKQGIFFQKDLKQAFIKFQAAAEQGLIEAEYQLGIHYEREKDTTKAKYWYTRAKNQGHKNAQKALNRVTLNGL